MDEDAPIGAYFSLVCLKVLGTKLRRRNNTTESCKHKKGEFLKKRRKKTEVNCGDTNVEGKSLELEFF